MDAGDASAFEALVRPVLPVLRDTALRAGLDSGSADDAVQDALAQLARERGARPVEVGLVPWLVRAVRLRALTLGRSARRRAAHERRAEPRAAPGASDALDAREQAERLLGALDGPDQEILRLRFVYDLEYREIAFILEVPAATCRVRVHRAAARLRSRFGEPALALLPALMPSDAGALSVGVAARQAALGASLGSPAGGLLMSTSLKVTVATLLASALAGAWLMARQPEDRPPPPEASPRGAAMTAVPSAAPTLAGRASPPAQPPQPAAAPEPSPTPPAVRAPPPSRPTIERLAAQIREAVEPDAWTPLRGGEIRSVGSTLAVRASPGVLDAVQAHLEDLRAQQAEAHATVEPPHTPPATVPPEPPPSEAQAALHTVLLGLLSIDERMREVLEALAAGEGARARALLEQVRTAQPDFALLAIAERALTSPDAAADLRRSLDALAQAPSLQDWVLRWPSVATWTDLAARVQAAGGQPLAARGAELVRRLDTVRVQRESLGGPLHAVLRALQVEGLVDVRVDGRLASALSGVQVVPFRSSERTLRQALDDVVRALPSWVVVEVRPDAVWLTRADLLPELRLRYFDVADLVEPARPATADGAPAPAPPEGVLYPLPAPGAPPPPGR